MKDPKRPWKVVVYIGTSHKPVREFDRYLTERDASGFAEVLREQAKRNGWNHTIRVETETT